MKTFASLIVSILLLASTDCEKSDGYYQCDFRVKIYDQDTRELLETVIVRSQYDWGSHPDKFDTIVFWASPRHKKDGIITKQVERPRRGFRVEKIHDSCIRQVPMKRHGI